MTGRSSRLHIMDIATRFQAARVVHVAAVSGLAEFMRQESVTAELVSAHLGWEPLRAFHFLNALCALGLVEAKPEGYALSSTGQFLMRDDPSSVYPMVQHEDLQQRLWSNLPDVLASELPVAGQQDRSMVEEDGRLAVLLEAMLSIDGDLPRRLASRAGWERVHRIADIGGGHGGVLARIAELHSNVSGVVLDQAPARPVAEKTFLSLAVEDRCAFAVTDLTAESPLPDGIVADCFIACRCLHNFSSPVIRRILQACKSQLQSGGILIVVDVRLEWKDGFAMPLSAAVFGGYLAVNCAGGWLPPASWWRKELMNLGGSYSSEPFGVYDLHEVAF